ncbi:MAG TPA: Dabb family protein [Phycisphaerales bacterium]|nr:Dabb family protein [Phycisphaerales bacterium]
MRGLMARAGVLTFVIVVALMHGCDTQRSARTQDAVKQFRTASIQHVVLISLKDPNDAGQMISESLPLGSIPAVRSFACGKRVETGRGAPVSADYDVGYVFGFDDPAGYDAYVHDARHQALLSKWKPKIAGMRIFDFGK